MKYGPAVIAIDPGSVSGAFALFKADGQITVHDLAVVDKRVDAAALSRVIRDNGVGIAVVEKVSAMPKQGVTSSFNFGYACGTVYGVLAACGVELNYVPPRVWKAAYKLDADKEKARALAIRLYPELEGLHLKRHHGRAEALLLGRYLLNPKE